MHAEDTQRSGEASQPPAEYALNIPIL